MKNKYVIQLFDAEANTTKTTDLEPAISIDHTNRLHKGIKKLLEVLGITETVPMSAGTQIKIYRCTKTNAPAQVAEGDVIPLTKVERKLARTIELVLKKYRKQTTAEAIQKTGRDVAINQTDEKLASECRVEIKNGFFSTIISNGTGTATAGATFQAAVANVWGALQAYFEDYDEVTPVFFVNPLDVAAYLGSASITTQTAFGLSYIQNFLGMGNAIVTTQVAQGTVAATATQNLNCAYVPAGGDVAQTFGLTFDESGLVGMVHNIASDRASVDTLMMSGVVFYAEDLSGVIVGSIAQG